MAATRDKNTWALKVLGLVKGGNLAAALAQTQVAPSEGDIVRLQGLLAALPTTPLLRQFATQVEEARQLMAAPRLHRSP
ncbi:MAG: hypothetical protein ACTS8S_01515 [Giesbergeria sp.]